MLSMAHATVRRATAAPFFALAPFVALGLFLPACFVDGPAVAPSLADGEDALVVASEGFESGTKASYAAADVTLPSGTWNLDEALIGTLDADAKAGTRSVRVRGSGRLTMRFDATTGISTVTVKHARYGSDATGSLALYWSSNGGSTWTQAGSAVTVSSTSLVTSTFTVGRTGTVRVQLRKVDGGSGRINLDDVVVNDAGTAPDPDPDPDPGSGDGASVSAHTALGLPSPASTARWNDYLAVKSQFVLSYNSSRKVPNWVSWEITSAYLGSASRQDDYRPDTTLPSGMPQAALADYSGSGWDRGHMCPSADRTRTTAANSQTFLLSNMLPQATNNNGGPWARLETYSRTLAQSGKQVYVVAGGVFVGTNETIGNGVSVPDDTWKVVVVLDRVGAGAAAVTTATRVIAVVIPNDDGDVSASDDWQPYRVSVDDIEAMTGYDLLSDVANSVEAVVEARVDTL
jgi:endonuclease G